MARALMELGGTRKVAMFIGDSLLPRMIRKSVCVAAEIEIETKRWIKRVLLRRE